MRVNTASRGISETLLLIELVIYVCRVWFHVFYEGAVVEASGATSCIGLTGHCRGVAASQLARTHLSNAVLGHPTRRIRLRLLRIEQLDAFHFFALVKAHISVFSRLFSVGVHEASLGRGSCRPGR